MPHGRPSLSKNPPPCLWHQWSAPKAAFSLALSLSPGQFALVSLLGLACIVVLRSSSPVLLFTQLSRSPRPLLSYNFSLFVLARCWSLFGCPWSHILPIVQVFLITGPVRFTIYFQMSFLSMLESQNLLDLAVAYTRRSKSKTSAFHF